MKLVQLDHRSDAYMDLITRSHQTSLFVLPEWIDLYKDDLELLGVEDRGRLVAGCVAQLTSKPLAFVPYQGMLLTRREHPAAARMMLEELEKLETATVINAPSLVDVRPFFWRLHEGGGAWFGHIQYTFFTSENTRPFSDMPTSSDPFIIAEAWKIFEDQLPEHPLWLEQMDSVRSYANHEGGCVMWGTDLQDRGYLIASCGNAEGLAWKLAQRHPSTDLYGCNSPAMNKRKRVFGGTLRTYYRMSHVK